ncbi:MAG: protease inhibitor I42 family protein, partial [Thermoleophilia bacterium]|nr:protease inhibitor I42 family protein [Thermoleophilia bacterium]
MKLLVANSCRFFVRRLRPARIFIALICGMLVGGTIAGGALIGGTFLAGSVLTGCGNSLDISSSATTSLADAGNPEKTNLPQRLHLTMKDSGQTFVIRRGGIVEIVLPSNPSSGWFWQMVEPDPEVSLLEQVGEPVYHAGATSEGGTAAAGSSATRGGSSGDDSSSAGDSSSSTSNTSTTSISATSAEPT